MAKFVRIWVSREKTLDNVVEAARVADANRVTEYKAVVRIQSWFRGNRLRAYLRYLNECAVVIQKHFRGFLGRRLYLHRLRECVQEMYNKHYNDMATRIQAAWKGYYVRKFVFNYHSNKKYLIELAKNNETVLNRLKIEREKAIEEQLDREERLQELILAEQARRHHYMLSTECQDGVFSLQRGGSVERTMKTLKFHHSNKPKTLKPPKPKDSVTLPPLVEKVQGPFRSPEQVWTQRVKPLSPTLRVSTDYNSQDMARSDLRAEEWRTRVIDDKFLPFSRRPRSYKPLIHTQSPFQKPAYGTQSFRVERPVNKQPFKTVVPPIPIFDKLNSTY